MDPLEGKTGFQKSTGQRVIRQNGQWVPLNAGGKPPPAQEASLRGRMDLGLAPMVQGQEDMTAIEKRGNPFSLRDNPDNAVAKVLGDVGFSIPGIGVDFHPLNGVAKSVGGQDYQNYEQAQKSFEAEVMPIKSGAAVSPSEAARQIKASLPELGDSPQTLATKSRNRAMMLNGAAKARGMPLPYPDVPTWGVNTLKTSGNTQAGGGQPKVRRYNPQTGEIE